MSPLTDVKTKIQRNTEDRAISFIDKWRNSGIGKTANVWVNVICLHPLTLQLPSIILEFVKIRISSALREV